MIEIQIERFSQKEQQLMQYWLRENFGPWGDDTWSIEYNVLIENLICREDIAAAFILRWA